MAPGLCNAPPSFEPPPVARLKPGDLPEIYPEEVSLPEPPLGELEPISGPEEMGGSVNSGMVSRAAADSAPAAEEPADSAEASADSAEAIADLAEATADSARATADSAEATADSAEATTNSAATEASTAAAATTASATEEREGAGKEKDKEAWREAEEGASHAGTEGVETAAGGGDGGEGDEASPSAGSGVAAENEGEQAKLEKILAVEAENSRLVSELADARAKLERFERDAQVKARGGLEGEEAGARAGGGLDRRWSSRVRWRLVLTVRGPPPVSQNRVRFPRKGEGR